MSGDIVSDLAIAGLCLLAAFLLKWVANAIIPVSTKLRAASGENPPVVIAVGVVHVSLWLVAIWHACAILWGLI